MSDERFTPLSADHCRRLADGIEKYEASFITPKGDGWLTPTERVFIASLLRTFALSETEGRDSYKEAIAQNLKLRKALEQCVRVAESWHGDDAFDIYFNHAPEMKLIREALGKMPDPTEAE